MSSEIIKTVGNNENKKAWVQIDENTAKLIPYTKDDKKALEDAEILAKKNEELKALKAKILILIVFLMVGIWSFSQEVARPPLRTSELNLIDSPKFIWDEILMYRDSMMYFEKISDQSFRVHPPGVLSWETFTFNKDTTNQNDSVYIEWEEIYKGDRDTIHTPPATALIIIGTDTIVLIDGGTFTRNDSTFQVRIDPDCIKCWEYKYATDTEWKRLFCESSSFGEIIIAKNAQDIFWMYYARNGTNFTDSLNFKIALADSNKVLTLNPDSTVTWKLPDKDSIFDRDFNEWISDKDSLRKRTDSLFYYSGKHYNRLDTLTIEEIDTLFWFNDMAVKIKDTIVLDTIFYANDEPVLIGDSIEIENYWHKYESGEKYFIDAERLVLNKDTSWDDGEFYGNISWGTENDLWNYPFIGTYEIGGEKSLYIINDYYGMILYPSNLIVTTAKYSFQGDTLQMLWGGSGYPLQFWRHESKTLSYIGNSGNSNPNLVIPMTESYIGIYENPRFSMSDTSFIEAKINYLRNDTIENISENSVLIKKGSSLEWSQIPDQDTLFWLNNQLVELKDTITLPKDSTYYGTYAGWVQPGDSANISLYDLTNVDPEQEPENGDVLNFQSNTGKWTNTPLGTMSKVNYWFGTATEYAADTEKNGVLPKATGTMALILN